MCVGEGISYVAGDAQRLVDGQLLFTGQPISKGLPRHKRHHEVEEPVGLAGIKKGYDMGMRQIGGRLDFPEEAFSSQRSCQVGGEDLQGDLPLMAKVLGQEDGGHASASDLSLDRVPVAQSNLQRFEKGRDTRLLG
jgi:hypothetical protein